MAEQEALKRKQEEEIGKRKKLEVKDFLLMQMGQVSSSSVINNPMHQTDASGFINMPAPSQFGGMSTVGAQRKGKAMNIEELRINKQLLKEISKRKKEKIYNSQEQAASVVGEAVDEKGSAAHSYQ